MAQKVHSVMVFPFSLCQLGMSGMSGMPFSLFPLCLNPEGPRDMFWLLPQTAHCPGILEEAEDFCLCAAPAPTPGQTGAGPCYVKASHKGPALSEILRKPSPAARGPNASALGWGDSHWGGRAQLGLVLFRKLRVFSITAPS